MRFLQYKDLDLRRVKASFAKIRTSIEAGDFKSPDVKKLHVENYYRAKLDHSNRLLLQFAKYGDETVCLALEVIENHAYDKSRFLRGARVDEAKIELEPATVSVESPSNGAFALRWLHASRAEFELLDKPIIFDDEQEAVRRLLAPLILVGSAGSGKTALTLSKMREAPGRVLYVTQSAYLAQSARALYDNHGYENLDQEPEFLSFREFLETLQVPKGREITFGTFSGWFDRNRAAFKGLAELDAHALFEEFRGVISAQPDGPLSLQEYLVLGPRQSLLSPTEREVAHALFVRYCKWLDESAQFDLNLVAHGLRPLVSPTYDFIVVDEVQDLTMVMLTLVLACLKNPSQFLLCGDSNQIVHPNFFSWAAVRSLFWNGLAGDVAQRQAVHILQANFRNTKAVTELANSLLKIKQARFGSVDRESNFLVHSTSGDVGEVRLMPFKEAMTKQLDAVTRVSVKHAVIVLRDEDKSTARASFRTPLVFSVHEAKGLEYPHVILFNIVSGQRAAFTEVCDGVSAKDLDKQVLDYRRAKDKTDKSLELYKFYVNALYVAMTRAVQTLTVVESDTSHPLLALLGLHVSDAQVAAGQVSSKEEWAQEARKLELQGKQEQAQLIRDTILQFKPVPWTPWSQTLMVDFASKALDRSNPSAKPRQALMDYALWHGQHAWIEKLARINFQPAKSLVPDGDFGWIGHSARLSFYDAEYEQQTKLAHRAVTSLRNRHLQAYAAKNFKDILRQCDVYGVDHLTTVGATPLMLAARAGNLPLVHALIERGANQEAVDEFGHTPWQHALSRALEEPDFAKLAIGALFDLIAPVTIDVQVDSRLVRIERHQGEYWVFSLMISGLKTQWSRCCFREQPPWKFSQGFFAEQLHGVLSSLPVHLWKEIRRKRSYINQVLARGEIDSSYNPARKLWSRIKNGHYFPNPDLLVRRGEDWHPVYDSLNMPWIDMGTASLGDFGAKPMANITHMKNRDSTVETELF
jgi:hypothetical protein